MAVILYAPFEQIEFGVALPNPQIGNTTQSASSITVKRTMDGSKYTYVVKSSLTKFSWDFILTRLKSFELRGLIQSYHSAELLVIDSNDIKWRAKLLNNPFELVSQGYRKQCREEVSITLEFEGVQIP